MQLLPINDITEITYSDSSQKKTDETPTKPTKKRNTNIMQACNSVAGLSNIKTCSTRTTHVAMETSKYFFFSFDFSKPQLYLYLPS